MYLVLLLSHLIGYSLSEFGLWGGRWLLRGGAAVAEPIGEGLMGFLSCDGKERNSTAIATKCVITKIVVIMVTNIDQRGDRPGRLGYTGAL